MTLGLFWEHLFGLTAPAVGVALILWLALGTRRGTRASRFAQLGLLAMVGVAVLVAGLVVYGRDGKMLTYAALVLAQGSAAWWLRGRA